MKRHNWLELLGTVAVVITASFVVAQENDRERERGERGLRGFNFVPNPLMLTLDTDKDGTLSSEEIAKASESLKALDEDKDGALSADELRAPRIIQEAFVARIMSGDKNKDGKLTKEEMPERAAAMFERLDANSDGSVDKAELETAMTRLRGLFRDRGEERAERDRLRDRANGDKDHNENGKAEEKDKQ